MSDMPETDMVIERSRQKRKWRRACITIVIVACLIFLMNSGLSMYQARFIRLDVGGGLYRSEVLKKTLSDFYQTQQHWPQGNTSEERLAVLQQDFSQLMSYDKIVSVTLYPEGVIQIQFSEQVKNITLVLTPEVKKDGQIVWNCQSPSNIQYNWVSPECRDSSAH